MTKEQAELQRGLLTSEIIRVAASIEPLTEAEKRSFMRAEPGPPLSERLDAADLVKAATLLNVRLGAMK